MENQECCNVCKDGLTERAKIEILTLKINSYSYIIRNLIENSPSGPDRGLVDHVGGSHVIPGDSVCAIQEMLDSIEIKVGEILDTIN